MIYEKLYELRVSDFDKNDNLKPSAIMDAFQSVADLHATKLGVGYTDLLSVGCVWMLVRAKFEVLKPVKFGESQVVVKTWPHVAGKVDYDRDYVIESTSGETLVKGTSKWCVVNMQTRRIALGKAKYPLTEFYPERNFEGDLKKLPDFDLDGANKFKGYAGESALDHNGHVNNVRYFEFILDATPLDKNEQVKTVEINYLNELIVGDYDLYFKKDGDNRLIKGFSCDKESFRAQIITTKIV